MIIADSPSRWPSHVGRVQELILDLPLPPLRVHEVIRKLFTQPEELKRLIAMQQAHHRVGTTLGKVRNPGQGEFVQISEGSGALSAVMKLEGCSVSGLPDGWMFGDLAKEANPEKFLDRKRSENESVHLLTLPRKVEGKQSKSVKSLDVTALAKFCLRDCREMNDHGRAFAVVGAQDESWSPHLHLLMEEAGVFDVVSDACKFGIQPEGSEGSDSSIKERVVMRTNMPPLAPASRVCAGATKLRQHVQPTKRSVLGLADHPAWVKRVVEAIKETGLVKGTTRLSSAHEKGVIDNHGRRVVFSDSNWHGNKLGENDSAKSVNEKSAFATPCTPTDSDPEDEFMDLMPCEDTGRAEFSHIIDEGVGEVKVVRTSQYTACWPAFPRVAFPAEKRETLLDFTARPGREIPTDKHVSPLCLRRTTTTGGTALGVEYLKPQTFADGTTKDVVLFIPDALRKSVPGRGMGLLPQGTRGFVLG